MDDFLAHPREWPGSRFEFLRPLYPDKRPLACPIHSSRDVRLALEELFRSFRVRGPGDNAGERSRQSAIIGAIIGLLLGLSPMGPLFGVIGMAIGIALGVASGLGVQEAAQLFVNRHAAALKAVERGDYTHAIAIYRKCFEELFEGGKDELFLHYLRKLGGEDVDKEGRMLGAAYLAACGLLNQVQAWSPGAHGQLRRQALEDYRRSLEYCPSNQAVLQTYISLLDLRDPGDVSNAIRALETSLRHLEETTPDDGREAPWWNEELIGIFELWAKVQPHDTENLRRLANCYCLLDEGDNAGLERALDVLRALERLQPDDAEVTVAIRTVQRRLDMLDTQKAFAGIRDELRNLGAGISEAVEKLRADWHQHLVVVGRDITEEDIEDLAERTHSLVLQTVDRGTRQRVQVHEVQRRLECGYPLFPSLCSEAQEFLAVGEFLWDVMRDLPSSPDCSAVAVEYSKALEAEIRALIKGFGEYLERRGVLETFLRPYIERAGRRTALVDEPAREKHACNDYFLIAEALYALMPVVHPGPPCKSRYRLTVVQVANILKFPEARLTPGALMARFREYLEQLPGAKLFRDADFYKAFLKDGVGHRYRNGAAHTERLTRDLVMEFRTALLEKPGYLWEVTRGRAMEGCGA
ncbi:MAG: hypothetical protein NUW12_02620 [Firmicutes bacterium]|jgi:tetratricopeptide (TPR) repeat protein|nr:hypothetical protein [Bacillota bacterium]MDH7494660.1 hypothetical protein [Bacillota bacterium]